MSTKSEELTKKKVAEILKNLELEDREILSAHIEDYAEQRLNSAENLKTNLKNFAGGGFAIGLCIGCAILLLFGISTCKNEIHSENENSWHSKAETLDASNTSLRNENRALVIKNTTLQEKCLAKLIGADESSDVVGK